MAKKMKAIRALKRPETMDMSVQTVQGDESEEGARIPGGIRRSWIQKKRGRNASSQKERRMTWSRILAL